MNESTPSSLPEQGSVLGQAIKIALTAGAATAASFGATNAQAQTAASGDEKLEEVIVTGSRIPRAVDEATASPVTTIDSSQIASSGLQTTGDIVSALPTISGAATNTQLNNGGGFGEANIELRGLDAKRTLILLNGRRVGVVGNSGAVDVNQIPVSIIDHIDVLKEGAGAVYGSDAIAGVVNFVTRKGVDGLEIGGEYGADTTKGDGKHDSVNVLWGGGTDKLDILVGGSYTKQEKVSADNRNFSKDALYLYSGSSFGGRGSFAAGSSRVPNGRASLPSGNPLRTALGCSNVTRTPGTSGTSLTDYECLTSSYNFQPFNLLITPSERGSVFTTANYKITDDLEFYSEVLYNTTHSGFQIAPLPFDATADDVIVSAANAYNPFGISFGGLETTNSNYRTRFVSLGNRFSASDSDSKLITAGLKGKIGDTGWDWDANVGYNRLDQAQKVSGYVYFPALQAAIGPSYTDANGDFQCGTDAAHQIAGCTPINFFNLDDPATIAALKGMATSYSTNNSFVTETASFGVNGELFPLPAGAVQSAMGFEYRHLATQFDADYLIQADAPLFLKCLISNEACSGSSEGAYSSAEFYGEFFVPILKDLPGAKELNVDLGVRYSDYSKFGSTTKSQGKLEWKPISDLLIRGTYAQVFRVPTLADLYAAPVNSSAPFTDPCFGIVAADVAANPNLGKACANAPLDGTFSTTGVSQITALITANANLKPETGNVITYGFVLNVPGVENLSLSVDNWRYDIKNIITTLDPNYSIQQCIATGADAFCNLVTRFAAGNNQGQIEVFQQPTVNLGELKEDGVDIGVHYLMNGTPAGTFRFGVDATYINKYESISLPGTAPVEEAGTYSLQFGNYARWRGTIQVGWANGPLDALLNIRYIHSLVVHDPAGVCASAFCPDFTPNNVDLQLPHVVYADVSMGYNIKATNTKFMVGIQNLTNRYPPIVYMNNTANSNADTATYDLLGRRFFLAFTQKL